IDTEGVSDPHAFYFANDRNDGGRLRCGAGNVTQSVDRNPMADACDGPRLPAVHAPSPTPFLNYIRNPDNPLGSPTVFLDRATRWANTGQGTKWVPINGPMFGVGNHHRIVAVRDQITGRTRLIFGTDFGIYTGVDSGDGQYMRSIGAVPSTTQLPLAGAERDVNIVFGSRNGNLEIVQMYAGAVQPNLLAGERNSTVPGMLHSSTQNTGRTSSRVGILDPASVNYGVTRWMPPS